MRRILKFQLVRFVLVGLLNTGFSYGIYAALLYAGADYVAANFGALVLGILFSFRTQGTLVFRNPSGRLFYRFCGSWLLIFLLNIGLITALLHVGLSAYAAGALALAPVAIGSFVVQKLLVFGPVRTTAAAKPAG